MFLLTFLNYMITSGNSRTNVQEEAWKEKVNSEGFFFLKRHTHLELFLCV